MENPNTNNPWCLAIADSLELGAWILELPRASGARRGPLIPPRAPLITTNL
jgi:hypothetical protein